MHDVISDFAPKKRFLAEMEKSAAIMALYGAEFGLVSVNILLLKLFSCSHFAMLRIARWILLAVK